MKDPETPGLKTWVERTDLTIVKLASNLMLERAKAQQLAMIALDQKTAQVAALQSAAVVVAATVADAHASIWVTSTAAIGALIFGVAAIFAFSSALPRASHIPGPDATHWTVDYPDVKAETEFYFSSMNLLQFQLSENRMIANSRSLLLRISLLIATIAAIFLVAAACMKLIPASERRPNSDISGLDHCLRHRPHLFFRTSDVWTNVSRANVHVPPHCQEVERRGVSGSVQRFGDEALDMNFQTL